MRREFKKIEKECFVLKGKVPDGCCSGNGGHLAVVCVRACKREKDGRGGGAELHSQIRTKIYFVGPTACIALLIRITLNEDRGANRIAGISLQKINVY